MMGSPDLQFHESERRGIRRRRIMQTVVDFGLIFAAGVPFLAVVAILIMAWEVR